jgi:hypothetical protein
MLIDLRSPFKSWPLGTGAHLCSIDGETATDPGTEALAPEGEQGQDTEGEVAAQSDTDDQEAEANADGDAPSENDEDFEDYDHDGKTFKVHKDLKPALLRQADYTQKTQTLAQERQNFEQLAQTRLQTLQQRETALQAVEEAAQAVSAERVNLEIAKKALAQYDDALRAAYANGDQAEVSRLMFERGQWQMAEQDANAKASEAQKKLDDERKQLSAKSEESRQEAFYRGAQSLATDPVIALTPPKFEKVIQGLGQFGIDPALIFDAVGSSPQTIKFAALALDAMEENKKLKAELAARKGTPPASAAPATRVNGGSAGANARKTTDASGDGLSAEEWHKRELARVAAKRANAPVRQHPLMT